MSRNLIQEIEGLAALSRLKILALQHNRIQDIKGLEALVSLEELYLSNNRISCLQGLGTMVAEIPLHRWPLIIAGSF